MLKTSPYDSAPPITGETPTGEMTVSALEENFRAMSLRELSFEAARIDELLESGEDDGDDLLERLQDYLADATAAKVDGYVLYKEYLDKEIEIWKAKRDALLEICGKIILAEEESLAPFWDRLTLRVWVSDVSRNAKRTIMTRRAGLVPVPTVTTAISRDELALMRGEAIASPLDGTIVNTVLNVTDHLQKENGIVTSTRKHDQLVDLLRCYAYASGGQEVDDDHLELLEHVLWNRPAERPLIRAALKKFADPLTTKANEILSVARNLFNDLPAQPDGQPAGVWMREVGAVDLQLQEMEGKIDELIASARASRSKKLKSVRGQVGVFRAQVQALVRKAYEPSGT